MKLTSNLRRLAAPAMLALAFGVCPPLQAQAVDASLYQALGERPGIAALMADVVPRLKTDPRLAGFFEKTNLEELARHLTDQVCQVAGGPCKYEGADMKTAHADFDIRPRDFHALVEVLQQGMDRRGLPFPVQNRLLARLAPMHRDVITQP
jgi:hemoglobin